MPLNLYRRHGPGCEGGHAEDSRSGEFDERKKGWRRCACGVFVSGTLDREFGRKATGSADWAETRRIADLYEKADSWAKRRPQPLVFAPAATEPTRIGIADAFEVFHDTRAATVAPPTFRKDKTFAKQLQTVAESLGYIVLDQFRPADIDVCSTQKSKLRPRSKAKMLERPRGFFRFAVHREWIRKSPVSPEPRAACRRHQARQQDVVHGRAGRGHCEGLRAV